MDPAEIKGRLREFICTDLLGRPDYPLDDREPLITGGLIDSFSLARVGAFAEQAFQADVADADLSAENMDTVDAMVRTILKARG